MKPLIIEAHQSDPNSKTPDPYRIFFSMGIFFGLVGVAVWPMLALGWINYPNPLWHMDLLLQGFLFSFILGFLLTALPRFSQTWPTGRIELGIFVFTFVIGNLGTLFSNVELGRICFFLNLTFMFVYSFRRFYKRGANPPAEFVFVIVGLVLGWLGGGIRMLSLLDLPFTLSEILGRRLLSEGMVLMLILGVGGKLAPMFWGFSLGSPLSNLGKDSLFTKTHKIYLSIAAVICASFLIEYQFLLPMAGLVLRALAVSFVLFYTLRIHKKPKTTGVLVTLLRTSFWAIFLALWGAVCHPGYRLEVLHVLFIGGFGMMVLTIATRVVISHGNYPLELEKKSVALASSGILLMISLVFRSIASLMGAKYYIFLGIAGAFWMIGLVWWGTIFVPKMIFINRTGKQTENLKMKR